jgi:hypothetical protein
LFRRQQISRTVEWFPITIEFLFGFQHDIRFRFLLNKIKKKSQCCTYMYTYVTRNALILLRMSAFDIGRKHTHMVLPLNSIQSNTIGLFYSYSS